MPFARKKTIPILILLVSIVSQIVFIAPTSAATAIAGGAHSNKSACNQTVSDATNVEVNRIADGDCVIQFKSGSVTWTAPQSLTSAQVLIVGGGGAGGSGYNNGAGGGGGAGQVKASSDFSITPNSIYTIVIGAGSIAATSTSNSEYQGGDGESSKIQLNGSDLISALGGRGGSSGRSNKNSVADFSGGSAATSSTQSLGGGRGGTLGSNAGGGGGSSGAGSSGQSNAGVTNATKASGGSGTTSNIRGTGSPETFGGGGAGGIKIVDGTPAESGATAEANSGNGGGGASTKSSSNADGGAGGSGIVIIRFGLPEAPTITSITPGDKNLMVSFTSGSPGSASISDYEYSINSGPFTSAGTTSSPIRISSLQGRTSYSISLRSRSAVGFSTNSSAFSATTLDFLADALEARKAKEQRELTEILSIIPKIAELTLSLGETTKILTSTKCVKGKTTQFVKKGAKCPKGFARSR